MNLYRKGYNIQTQKDLKYSTILYKDSNFINYTQ